MESIRDYIKTGLSYHVFLLMKKHLILLTTIFCFQAAFTKAQRQPSKLLRHVVTVTFKAGSSAKAIREVDQSFKNLARLTVVQAYEWGISPADGHQRNDIKHVYVSTFLSEKELASYGASPEHQRHIKIGTSIIKAVEAVDYWVMK